MLFRSDQITEQTVKVQIPPRYKSAVNIYDNQPLNIENGVINNVQVPFEGVSVLRLS